MHTVRVTLTDQCPDSFEEIVYGDGSKLGPMFDKIELEAKMCGGIVDFWEPSACDFVFVSKELATRFINNIKQKFSNQIMIEYYDKGCEKIGMRNFKELPKNIEEKIAILTPKKILDIDIQFQLLFDDSALIEPSDSLKEYKKLRKTHRLTFANMRCKVTGKTRSLSIVMRSGMHFALPIIKKTFVTIDDFNSEIAASKKSGWSESDFSYDSIINGIMIPETTKGHVNGKDLPEIHYACDSGCIVISDYNEKQFVGWFFYNKNLDELIGFTNYYL